MTGYLQLHGTAEVAGYNGLLMSRAGKLRVWTVAGGNPQGFDTVIRLTRLRSVPLELGIMELQPELEHMVTS